MRRLLLAALGAILASAFTPAAHAQRGPWILQDASTVRFECAGEQIRDPAGGRFSAMSSRLSADPANLAAVRGDVEVHLVSITSDLPGWDAMFRSAPFLAIDEHPRSRFELQRVLGVQALTPGRWARARLVGRLTVAGETRDVTIPARLRWSRAEGDTPERLEVDASFPIRWDTYRIAVPDGWTRHFAGDLAQVRVQLVYHRGS